MLNVSDFLCTFTLTVSSDFVQTFSSPNFPNEYRSDLNCTWTLIAAEGTQIGLDFRSFCTERTFDVVTVSEQADHYSPDMLQRWSPRGRPWPRGRPRGHFLKSLALASKVKSLALASRPEVLENWPVLGSRTALFSGMLKFCGVLEKFFGKRFLVEIA